MTTDEALIQYVQSLPELREFASHLCTTLGAMLGKYQPTILHRIKPFESVLEKVNRAAFSKVADVPDLVGIRVVVSTSEALYEVYSFLRHQYFVEATDTLHLQAEDSSSYILVRSKPEISTGVRAEIQILTQAAEARRALNHQPVYGFFSTPEQRPTSVPAPKEPALSMPAVPPSNPVLHLRVALNRFIELLAQPSLHEKRDIHPFIKQNPFLLYPNSDTMISEVPIGIGTEYRIDFLVRDPCGEYLLVEIENPNAPVVTRAGDLTTHVNHAICQVEDWQEWIESNLPMVEKTYPGIRSPEAWVVIGRDGDLGENGKRRVSRRNINMRGRVKIRTYDDVIRDANAYVSSIENALRRETW